MQHGHLADHRDWAEISEDESRAAIWSLYQEIRRTLGVRHVPLLYRVLAAREGVLEVLWPALQPLLESRAAEGFAEDARAIGKAFAREAAGPAVELPAEAAAEVRTTLRAYNTANPRNLLFALAARRMLEPVGDLDRIAWHPALEPGPALPREDSDEILEDIRRTHGQGGIPGVYRSLARWPATLAVLWRPVRPLLGSDSMRAAQERLKQAALRAVEASGHPLPTAPVHLRDPELASLLDWFVATAPAVIVEIEVLKMAISSRQEEAD